MPSPQQPRPARASGLPPVSQAWVGLFSRYTRWYLPRHLHSLRLSLEGWSPRPDPAVSRILYLNHASWWDPLVCLHLWNRFFRQNPAYALIDAAALAKYPFFRKLGFIGVERGKRAGAVAFLRAAESLAEHPGSLLWVTPQARFCDVRQRPLGFEPGLAHLAARLAAQPAAGTRTAPIEFVPLAVEYTHWHERTPEVLVRFGTPFRPHPSTLPGSAGSAEDWNQELEQRLASEMDALARLAQSRDPARFVDLLRGRSGVGGIYDRWRWLRAALGRRTFTPNHGTL